MRARSTKGVTSLQMNVIEEFDHRWLSAACECSISAKFGIYRVELVSHQDLPSQAKEWSARIQEAASSQKVHKAPNSNTQRLFEVRQMPRLFDNWKFDVIARHARRSWLLLQQSSWGQVDEPLPEFLCKPSVYKSQNRRNWKTTDMRKLNIRSD